jgi:hypothetical protein
MRRWEVNIIKNILEYCNCTEYNDVKLYLYLTSRQEDVTVPITTQ